jgi:hypothetical protein
MALAKLWWQIARDPLRRDSDAEGVVTDAPETMQWVTFPNYGPRWIPVSSLRVERGSGSE